MIVEHCEVDDTDNDEHTSHNGDNTLCIEDERILISKSDTYHDNLTSKFFPVLISTINSLVSGEIELVTDSDFGYEFPILYPSAYVSRSNALKSSSLFTCITPPLFRGIGTLEAVMMSKTRMLNYAVGHEVIRHKPVRFRIDDYTQYVPAVSVYALNLAGVRG